MSKRDVRDGYFRPATVALTFHWAEAFLKFGFDDGDFDELSDLVVEQIEDLGYKVEQAGSSHNAYIDRVTCTETWKDLWNWEEQSEEAKYDNVRAVIEALPDELVDSLNDHFGNYLYLEAVDGDCSEYGMSETNERVIFKIEHLDLVRTFLRAKFEWDFDSSAELLFRCNSATTKQHDELVDAFAALQDVGIFDNKHQFFTTWRVVHPLTLSEPVR